MIAVYVVLGILGYIFIGCIVAAIANTISKYLEDFEKFMISILWPLVIFGYIVVSIILTIGHLINKLIDFISKIYKNGNQAICSYIRRMRNNG